MELEKEQTIESDKQSSILYILNWGVPAALTGSRVLVTCLKYAQNDGSISRKQLNAGITEAAAALKLTPERAQRELKRVLMKAYQQAAKEAEVQQTLIRWLVLI